MVRDFNCSAINYLFERTIYEETGFDVEGTRLARYLIASLDLTRRILSQHEETSAFLDDNVMIAQRFYDFYILSQKLISCADEKQHYATDSLCMGNIDALLDRIYDLSVAAFK